MSSNPAAQLHRALTTLRGGQGELVVDAYGAAFGCPPANPMFGQLLGELVELFANAVAWADGLRVGERSRAIYRAGLERLRRIVDPVLLGARWPDAAERVLVQHDLDLLVLLSELAENSGAGEIAAATLAGIGDELHALGGEIGGNAELHSDVRRDLLVAIEGLAVAARNAPALGERLFVRKLAELYGTLCIDWERFADAPAARNVNRLGALLNRAIAAVRVARTGTDTPISLQAVGGLLLVKSARVRDRPGQVGGPGPGPAPGIGIHDLREAAAIQIPEMSPLIRSAAGRALLAQWDTLRGPRLLPERKEFDPAAVPEVLPSLVLVDLAGGEHLRLRLVGTVLTRLYGCDATGRDLEEIDFAIGPDDRAAVLGALRRAARERRPVLADGAIVGRDRDRHGFQALALPMSGAGADVERILVGLFLEQPPEAPGA